MRESNADLVLHNAEVVTMCPRLPRASLVAARDGLVSHVGVNEESAGFGRARRVIDCEGRTVIPGFIDAHMHVMASASRHLSVDCSPGRVSSIADIQHRIREQAAVTAAGRWIRAGGYNEFYLAERRHPTRHDLDRATSRHPIRLNHRSMHACVLNSAALALAGIAIDTEEPPGGLIERELDTGEPNGVLYGMNSYVNDQVMPPLAEDEVLRGVRLVNGELVSCGVTSIQDATHSNGHDQWLALSRLKQDEILRPRVTAMIGPHAVSGMLEGGFHARFGDDRLRMGPVKFMLDEAGGRLNPSQEALNEGVLEAHRAGFQVAIHAVEEGTVGAALTALEGCLKRCPGAEYRHRLEHCSVCPPPLLERLRGAGIIVVTQPAFVYYSGERYLADVPVEQLRWLYRTGSMRKAGVTVAAGSDCPVAGCNPLVGVYAAVTRRAQNCQELLPHEAVSPMDALAMYTLDAAFSAFEEDRKGSIEVGKLADMVVLSDDPTRVPAEEMMSIRAVATIIGGEVVWEA